MNSEILPRKQKNQKTSWQTRKQTKPILAFSFPGTGVSEVKIRVVWMTSAITAAGSGRASVATVYLSFRCSDSPGPVLLEIRQGPLRGTTSNASYTLDLFYKMLMCIQLNLVCLNACRSWLNIRISREKLQGARSEWSSNNEWADAECCLYIVHLMKPQHSCDYPVVFQESL